MSSKDSLNKQPYCRRSEDAWREIEQLYRAGATAKALAREHKGTERTIYSRARKYGWLRKDQRPTGPGMTPQEADAAARRLGAPEPEDPAEAMVSGWDPRGDAACRMLEADASAGQAAGAATAAAVRMLRDGQLGRAHAYARIAGLLGRLARTDEAAGRDQGVRYDPERTEAAMRFLAGRLGIEME